MVGVAPNATFLLASTEDTEAEVATEEDIWIEALEWGESLGIDVVSNSLGYADWYDEGDLNGITAPVSLGKRI